MLVRIEGLVARPDLNGALGVRTGDADDAGRVTVAIPRAKDPVRVLEKNLVEPDRRGFLESTGCTHLVGAAPGVAIVDGVLVAERPLRKGDRVLVEIVPYGTPDVVHEAVILDPRLFETLAPRGEATTTEEHVALSTQKVRQNGFCVGEHEHAFVGANLSFVGFSKAPNCTFDVMTSPTAPAAFAVILARRPIRAAEQLTVFRSHLSPDGLDVDVHVVDEVRLLAAHEADERLAAALGVAAADYASATLSFLRGLHESGVQFPADLKRAILVTISGHARRRRAMASPDAGR